MRIALVDDEKTQKELLKTYIGKELSSLGDKGYKISEFDSGESFLESFKEGLFDLIILDIYMGKLTGMEVAYRVRAVDEHVIIAFCTSSNEFASESYEVNAKHYLRKPITEESVSKMFRRFDLDLIEKNRVINLPDGKSIMLRKVLYTEYSNHNVCIYSADEGCHRIRISQGSIEELLTAHGHFCSPYKGTVVNFYAVEFVSEDSVKLTDGTVLPLTRRRQKEFKDAYTKFRFNRMRKETGTI
ncbi:MAG: response regulator transcription factor [Clostridia bacterium]|nr:response regulator transcription factor [Clostridia bacterium]MBQ7048814.1 response regulator transcription factor [Clostridia bacterium]